MLSTPPQRIPYVHASELSFYQPLCSVSLLYASVDIYISVLMLLLILLPRNVAALLCGVIVSCYFRVDVAERILS